MFVSSSIKNIRIFYLKTFSFLVVKILIYLNRCGFVMRNFHHKQCTLHKGKTLIRLFEFAGWSESSLGIYIEGTLSYPPVHYVLWSIWTNSSSKLQSRLRWKSNRSILWMNKFVQVCESFMNTGIKYRTTLKLFKLTCSSKLKTFNLLHKESP